jgi:IS1 family transposase
MDEYIWTAPGTDVTIRWRLRGWLPPSELKEFRDKWRYYQNLPLRDLDDNAKEQYEQVLRKAKVARIS